jgi:hypothetical protein
MSRPGGYDRVNVGNRTGLRAVLSNMSEATGQRENVEVVTTQMRDGSLLYTIGVAPSDEYSSYRGVFNRIVKLDRIAVTQKVRTSATRRRCRASTRAVLC